jgi:hypothetical protein
VEKHFVKRFNKMVKPDPKNPVAPLCGGLYDDHSNLVALRRLGEEMKALKGKSVYARDIHDYLQAVATILYNMTPSSDSSLLLRPEVRAEIYSVIQQAQSFARVTPNAMGRSQIVESAETVKGGMKKLVNVISTTPFVLGVVQEGNKQQAAERERGSPSYRSASTLYS